MARAIGTLVASLAALLVTSRPSLERTMKTPFRFVGALLLSAASLRAQGTGPREFKVDDAWGRDTVQFRTTAPMEEIVGTTNEVVGLVRIDPAAVRGPGTQARFDVDLTTIKTGIAMR